MSKILKTHPKSVQAHKDLILACLDDKDESIRLRALDLLYGMVSKKNLMEIVKKLLGHMERAEGSCYRDELLFKVIEICSQGSYQHVTNFEWYLTVLVELIQLEAGSKHGAVIADQLLDVTIRVETVRKYSVTEMGSLLENFTVSAQTGTMYEVLYAAAWIVGEFGNLDDDCENTFKILLRGSLIPGHIQAVYVQNLMKLYVNLVEKAINAGDLAGLKRITDNLYQKLPDYISSGDIEVQERACSAQVIMELIKTTIGDITVIPVAKQDNLLDEVQDEVEQNGTETPMMPQELSELLEELKSLFEGDLMPVAQKAQRKVQLPDGLDLEEWINGPPSESEDSSDEESKNDGLFVNTVAGNENEAGSSRKDSFEVTPEEMEKVMVDLVEYLLLTLNISFICRSKKQGKCSKLIILII